MSYRPNNDNIYAIGTVVYARENPELQLVIKQYNQRIYYCSRVNKPAEKDLAYFEREIIPPTK